MKKILVTCSFIFLAALGLGDTETPTTEEIKRVTAPTQKIIETKTGIDLSEKEIEDIVNEILEIPKIETKNIVETKTKTETSFEELFDSITETKEKVVEKKTIKKETSTVPLSNSNYYTNVDGDSVHSPAYAPSKPPGASAKCRDESYSFSRNRRGTCSGHGGVSAWY